MAVKGETMLLVNLTRHDQAAVSDDDADGATSPREFLKLDAVGLDRGVA